MKIAIYGAGYVGLSLYCLLIEHHDVILCDIDEAKVKLLQQRTSTIDDAQIQEVLSTHTHPLIITTDIAHSLQNADVHFIAVPTNYQPESNYFDTSIVDELLKLGQLHHPEATYVIKSTIPVGYTKKQQDLYPASTILFSPEFLREDHALHDNRYPSRIIVGDLGVKGSQIARLLADSALKEDTETLLTTSTEAEAIKLFSNTYLAMRISFFNELDTFSELHQIDSKRVISGVSLDPRIGQGYYNPSFGYGGYCLPKDTKQLLANYSWVPQNLIQAIVSANETRKDHIVHMILAKQPKHVGVYRLIMKKNSDNVRESSVLGVIARLRSRAIPVLIFEPLVDEALYMGANVTSDLSRLKKECDIILCNRYESELDDVKDKVYTRDIFSSDS